MTSDWMPVIGISVAVMALVQIATIIALLAAVYRVKTGLQAMERRVDKVIEQFQPQVARVVDEARAASASAHDLLTDIRRHLETMEDAADSVRQRVTRVVDGVQYAASAASHLPGPMKVSGPAVMAVWASIRVARSVAARVRERRRERHIRERQFREAESYIGVG